MMNIRSMNYEGLEPSQMNQQQLLNWARHNTHAYFATKEQLEQERKAGRVGDVYPIGKEFVVCLP